MKRPSPEFSSDIFDTFAQIVSGRSVVYIGGNQKLKNTELTSSKIKDLEVTLIKLIANKLGRKALTTIQSQQILKDIIDLQKKIFKGLKNNIEFLNSELNQSRPPMNHLILFFLVCACSDMELNHIKAKLRNRLRETKRQKAGKAADIFSDSIFDLQSLSVTGHWHQQTTENPIPTKVLEFASMYYQFNFIVNQTLDKFCNEGFPDNGIFKDLNKGRDVYFTWAIQSLVKIATAANIEKPSDVVSSIFKRLINEKFSIRPHIKKENYINLKDPHLLYMQLQALLICTRLIPM